MMHAVECAPWKAKRYILFASKARPVKAMFQSSMNIDCRGRATGEPFDIRSGAGCCEANGLMGFVGGAGRRLGRPAGPQTSAGALV